jgi:hypothetical protein
MENIKIFIASDIQLIGSQKMGHQKNEWGTRIMLFDDIF